MTKASQVLSVAKKPLVLIGAAGLVVVMLVWLFAFFLPQTHKLSSLETQKATLQQNVVLDQAKLQRVRQESHHVGQIQAIDSKLKGFVPTSEDLYTYIQTLSSAGNAAGVSISSLQPGTPVTATGTSYLAIPISADVKGTYNHLVTFMKAIYNLPRLTDINSISITGGGPGTNRSTQLSATFALAIFTSQAASAAG